MRRLLHRLAHRFGWNVGIVVSATDRHRLTWVGFRCARCGKVCGKQIAGWHRAPNDGDFT